MSCFASFLSAAGNNICIEQPQEGSNTIHFEYVSFLIESFLGINNLNSDIQITLQRRQATPLSNGPAHSNWPPASSYYLNLNTQQITLLFLSTSSSHPLDGSSMIQINRIRGKGNNEEEGRLTLAIITLLPI